MQLKWIAFVLMAWVITSLLVGVAAGALVGGTIDPHTGETLTAITINDLMHGDFFTRAGALGNMMVFNFPSVFYGGWAILRWIFFIPFAAAFGVMMLGYLLAHIPIIGRGT